jgi:hypothetical protein
MRQKSSGPNKCPDAIIPVLPLTKILFSEMKEIII